MVSNTKTDNFSNMNPMYGLHPEFKKMLDTMIIKYNYKAEKLETDETKRAADQYVAAYQKRDTFYTYRNYTSEELRAVGIIDETLIARCVMIDGYLEIPKRYHQALLENRRQHELQYYNEGNDYYRLMAGKPPVDTPVTSYHYLTTKLANQFNVDKSIPIHDIRQYYNALGEQRGDYIISNLEGLGILDNLIKNNPDEPYLQYIGHMHVPVHQSRVAKNFEILHVEQGAVMDSIFNTFTTEYEKAREYFMTVIYVRELRSAIYYYDNFIALCIMLMTIQNTINKQFSMGIQREFYTVYLLRMLYEAYGIPYDLTIDQYTQKQIARSLNLLIQRKSTDQVIYNIADLLGFSNLQVYKYFLVKDRKYDQYGVPIIETKKVWNEDTFQWDVVPDYEAMYDVYWQKAELKEQDAFKAFNDKKMRVEYIEPIKDDPYWWDDSYLYKSIWETEYNFVESKYFGITLSYKMSDIIYESVMLLKMLIAQKEPLDDIVFELPKIMPNLKVTMYDAVILLLCLTAKKHNLRGEIIAVPTQVLDVLDYMHNTDGGDEYLVDSFAFNFEYLLSEEGQDLVDHLNKILSPSDVSKLNYYVSALVIDDDLPNEEKVRLINDMFHNVKGLSDYIMFLMCKTDNRDVYESLKQLYRCAFYSREVKDIFTINEDDEDLKRTAYTFFEYLYHYNPALYGALFKPHYEEQYEAYLEKMGYSYYEYTLEDFIYDVEDGNIPEFTYSTLNYESTKINVKDELIYYYIEHILARIEKYISNLSYAHMINDAASTLEVLLIKFIRYFKSFTIDLTGMNVIYIMDMRSENTIKLLDEVARIFKWIQTHEEINLSYSDIAKLLSVYMDHDDSIFFKDKELHNKVIQIAKHHGIPFNHVFMYDVVSELFKLIEIRNENLSIYDQASYYTVNYLEDNERRDQHRESFFTDRVILQYVE